MQIAMQQRFRFHDSVLPRAGGIGADRARSIYKARL
jgi:hypothetical protein